MGLPITLGVVGELLALACRYHTDQGRRAGRKRAVAFALAHDFKCAISARPLPLPRERAVGLPAWFVGGCEERIMIRS